MHICIAQSNNRFQYLDDDLGAMSSTMHMMQDSYGYIWASTLSGLTRYDGYKYIHYTKSDSIDGLPDTYAFCSYEDQYNNIWVSLFDYGLAILDRKSDTFHWIKSDSSSSQGLRIKRIKAMSSDNKGNLYLLGDQGIQRVEVNNNNYDQLKFQQQRDFLPNIPEKIIGQSLLYDRNETMWIGTEQEIICIDENGTITQSSNNPKLQKAKTTGILEDSEGAVNIVRAGMPLLRYYDDNYEEDNNVKYPKRILVSTIDTDDNLWTFIRPGRIYKYHLPSRTLEKIKTLDLPYQINGSYSREPFVSKEGNLWVGGSGSFPFQHQPETKKEIKSIFNDNSKLQSSSCVYVDEDHIYIGQLINGLKIIDKKTGKSRSFTKDNSKILDNRIYQIIPLDKRRLCITGRGGVYVFDKSLQIVTKAKRFSYLIRCGKYFGNNKIWVSGGAKQIFKLDLEDMSTSSFFNSKDSLPAVHTVTQIVEAGDGTIWIAGRYQGVYHFYPDSGKWDYYFSESKDPNFKITSSQNESLHIDDEGDIWIGSKSGIDVIDSETKKIRTISKKDGLSHQEAFDIVQDDSLNYWVLSEKSIARIDKNKKQITNYDNKDGFINSLYYYRSFAKFDGNIFVAGELGVDMFNPMNMGKNQVPPDVVVSSIEVMGKPSENNNPEEIKNIEVDYNQNFINIECLPLHYVSPEKNELAYMIDGIHNEYINVGKRKDIMLSGLSSGQHKLLVKGANSDGIWSQPKVITIDVGYPWWRTWYFYLGLLLFGGLVIWYSFKRYSDKLKREQEAQEKINSQFAALELKALSSQMNPHFLFNSLNSIKSLINQNKKEEAGDFITRYSRLIRQVLNNSRSKFVRLEEEISTIQLYLELEQLRIGDSFAFDISVDDNVAADFIEVPPSLLQPYVENAIWHGLLNKTEGKKYLAINLSQTNNILKIRITDNGIGRKAARQIQEQSRFKNKSLGTLISKERIDLLSDVYGYVTKIETTDLVNEGGRGIGTEVEILIEID